MPSAVDALERALVDHERLPMPFEEARTRLLFGTVLRRAGRRSDARRELEAARTGSDGDLTAMELRIIALVGAGQTSREVARGLFMSVRTVDSHLGHVYRSAGQGGVVTAVRYLQSMYLPAGPPSPWSSTPASACPAEVSWTLSALSWTPVMCAGSG
jgi:DNA-binding CsgD family transcriptional regulator